MGGAGRHRRKCQFLHGTSGFSDIQSSFKQMSKPIDWEWLPDSIFVPAAVAGRIFGYLFSHCRKNLNLCGFDCIGQGNS
jgi:hypothetical protein